MLVIYIKRGNQILFERGNISSLKLIEKLNLKNSLFYACFYDTFQTPFFLIMSKGGREVWGYLIFWTLEKEEVWGFEKKK